jgi:two-component system OmpR family response regulator
MRILIVEDDVPLAVGLRSILESDGHETELTVRGKDALLATSRQRFDLIILDIGLVGMDGFEVLRRLRAEQAIPVLVLTARDEVADRVRGLDLGADDYLAKPFAVSEFTARVRAVLRRSQTDNDGRIVHGPLVVDLIGARAFLQDVPLQFSPREWAVLQVLLAKVGKVVPKAAIMDAIAGWAEDLSINAIEVYVSRLRSKLEPAGIKIRTVRGFGYMLEALKPPAEAAPLAPRLSLWGRERQIKRRS